ncbi:MAG: hypothetical protein QOI24_79 [Acidobacteriota bacterium]|jgi:hypothetical protein|nr:hypothetical protein [Acidobacteriota bacterium]
MTSAGKFCLLFTLTLASTLSAAAPGSEPIAQFRPSVQSVDFAPVIVSDGMRLTIIGPDGTVYEQDYAAGSAPSFRVQDVPRSATLNGTFTYELRAIPKVSTIVKSQLAAARAANDDAEVLRIQKANGLTVPLVQSGVFTILNGSVVSPSNAEPVGVGSTAAASMTTGGGTAAPRSAPVRAFDNVIADDLIVQGSGCIGLDCVNNEEFGFTTLKLKENNLRLGFDDTSTSAGFPANDWQLTANGSDSGGASKFSIEDLTNSKVPFTVRANTPTNSLYVDSTGNVGLGTATPVLDLHIATTDTPAIRFDQSNAGGFTAQTWDIGANEANFFVRDTTGGSRLSFRIRPGAPTSSIDIAASGNVGVGTASPNARLNVFDATQNASRITLSGQEFFQPSNTSADGVALLLGVNRTGNRQMWVTDSAMLAGPTPVLRFMPNAGDLSAISVNAGVVTPADLRLNSGGGNIGIGKAPTQPIDHRNGAYLSVGGVWTNASSRALKQDICDLETTAAKETLSQLEPVTYAYKLDPSEHHVGFIAEDVPELVATKERRGLSSMDIVAVLTKVVQDQQKTIDALQQRLEKIEKNER